MDLNEYLKGIASLVSSIIVVGGALIWIYKKLVSDPDKRIAEQIQRENSETLKQTVQPLTQSIELLNNNLKQGEKDREQLNKKVNLHDNIINNHETRITVLEERKKGVAEK